MLDLYQPCPCHQERKLKFCCGKEVVQQFSKVIEMMEGGQRLKAIQVMDKAIAEHGYRDCLATIRFATELESGDQAEATSICEHYVQENGPTSVAWTMKAMLAVNGRDVDAAIDHLQSALETLEPPSAMTCETMLNLGMRLVHEGRMAAARAQLMLYAKHRPGAESLAAKYLQMLRSSLNYWPYEKHEWPLAPIPDGRTWSLEAAQASHWAEQGLWRKALHVLLGLAEANPNEAVLWKNVAILAGRLSKQEVEQQAWGSFARCPGVPADHAVEAELLSLQLSPAYEADSVEELIVTYPVSDLPGFLEQAASDPDLQPLDEDRLQPTSLRRDETPVALFFASVDCYPTNGPASAGVEDGSHLLGLALYGKRTDRSAQLVVGVTEVPAVAQRLAEILAKYPQIDGASPDRISFGRQTKLLADFSPGRLIGFRRADQDLAPERSAQAGQQRLLERLPDYPTRLLDGKTFAEAAQLPEYHRRVEALLLALEAPYSQADDVRPTFETLRQRLGLPPRTLIHPKSVRLADLSLEQFTRLDFSQMPVKMLAWAIDIGMTFAAVNGLRSIVGEIERRLATGDEDVRQLPIAALYLFMAKIEGLPSRSADFLNRADRHMPEDRRDCCDLVVSGIEVCVGRRLTDHLVRLFEQLSKLAQQDEYCFSAYVKLGAAMGLNTPQPFRSGRSGRGSALSTADVSGGASPDAGGHASSAQRSGLWLPKM